MQRSATPNLRIIAYMLIEYEAGGSRDAAALAEAAERASEKLRLHFSQLVGGDGFQALLMRAVAQARRHYPELREVRVDQSGVLTGLTALVQRPDWRLSEPAAMSAVVANFLWLLVTFIGADLTRLLIQEIWPQVPIPDLSLGSEEAAP